MSPKQNIIRDFIQSWPSAIGNNLVFTDKVDKAIRCALLRLREQHKKHIQTQPDG